MKTEFSSGQVKIHRTAPNGTKTETFLKIQIHCTSPLNRYDTVHSMIYNFQINQSQKYLVVHPWQSSVQFNSFSSSTLDLKFTTTLHRHMITQSPALRRSPSSVQQISIIMTVNKSIINQSINQSINNKCFPFISLVPNKDLVEKTPTKFKSKITEMSFSVFSHVFRVL